MKKSKITLLIGFALVLLFFLVFQFVMHDHMENEPTNKVEAFSQRSK